MKKRAPSPFKGISYKTRLAVPGDMFITWEGTGKHMRPNLAFVTFIERWPSGGGRMRYVYWDFDKCCLEERECSGALDKNRIALSLMEAS